MSGRPKRTRNVPVRFGFENSTRICDDEEIRIEESPPRKANKVQRIKKEEDIVDLTQLGPVSHPPTSPNPPVSSPDFSYGYDASPSPLTTVPKQPGPRKKVTLTRAKADFKLNDTDLVGIAHDIEENPHGFGFAPMRLYKAIDCWNVAILKYGSPEGLQVAIDKGRQRGSKAKATRDLHAREKAEADQRRSSLRNMLRDYGIPSTYLDTDAEIMFYVSSGVGDLNSILNRVAGEAQHAQQQELERIEVARQILQDHGLLTASFETNPVFQVYIKTGQGLEQSIRKHGNNLQKERGKMQRIAALNQKMVQLGCPHQSNASQHHTLQEYMKGKESLDAAMPRYMAIVLREQ